MISLIVTLHYSVLFSFYNSLKWFLYSTSLFIRANLKLLLVYYYIPIIYILSYNVLHFYIICICLHDLNSKLSLGKYCQANKFSPIFQINHSYYSLFSVQKNWFYIIYRYFIVIF